MMYSAWEVDCPYCDAHYLVSEDFPLNAECCMNCGFSDPDASLRLWREATVPLTSVSTSVSVVDIQTQVQADIETRRQFGISKYGTGLMPHNGRRALVDLYDELLDAVMYCKQLMVEQGIEYKSAPEPPPT